MRFLFIFLEINFACLLPMLGWMLGAFILGWLLNQLFGGNKKAQLLADENNNLKQNNRATMAELNNKFDTLDAKHKATLNEHLTLKSKFETAATDAAKVSGLASEIALLKTQLNDANNKPPVTIEKRVEVPVEKIVEKTIEKPVEDLSRINALNEQVKTLQASLDAANNKPPVTVEKIVEKRVEVPVEKIVEKTIEKPVEDLTKINALNEQVKTLQASLDAANNKPPVTVEKIVEKRVEVPVEKIVEKTIEKPVEDLTKINALNEQIKTLQASLDAANNKLPLTVEKIVEKRVEVPVEKIVEKTIEKPVEDLTRINALNEQIKALQASLDAANNKPPVIVEKIVEVKAAPVKDYKAYARLYGKAIKLDDLKLVEGIGPKIEELFHNAGLKTWASVAASKVERLKEILVAGGERFQMHDPGTWPKQCQMMVDDKWEELKAYQDRLDGGKEPTK